MFLQIQFYSSLLHTTLWSGLISKVRTFESFSSDLEGSQLKITTIRFANGNSVIIEN